MRGVTAGVLLLLPALLLSAQAEELSPERPPLAMAIIIDDMGNNGDWGDGVLDLPGSVTYAFLPHTPHAQRLALKAHAEGKEVMLHLPMASHEGRPLGPNGLTLDMTEAVFKRTLVDALMTIPYAVGLNNHMGSLLTRHPGAMAWLMQGIKAYGELYFIDSRTSLETVGQEMAQEYGIDTARRDVFLDNNRDKAAIRRQVEQLIKQVRLRGHAIGIGHPYPETADVLRQMLPQIQAQGIELIPASAMIQLQGRYQRWHAASPHSPKVAKNSKSSRSAGPE